MFATKKWVESLLKKERQRTESEFECGKWRQDLWLVNAEKRIRFLCDYLNIEYPSDFELNTALPKARSNKCLED